MTTLAITGLHHDISNKRSIVYIVWENDPEKRLGLVLPFGCALANLKAETEKAVRALADELETATVKST
ncbi:MAG TPA: hypothetical protein VKT73_10165 [Xanthobacteraceae bacterium]|nr:hypothetical protein [Xanthobacteraceae bacterium]